MRVTAGLPRALINGKFHEQNHASTASDGELAKRRRLVSSRRVAHTFALRSADHSVLKPRSYSHDEPLVLITKRLGRRLSGPAVHPSSSLHMRITGPQLTVSSSNPAQDFPRLTLASPWGELQLTCNHAPLDSSQGIGAVDTRESGMELLKVRLLTLHIWGLLSRVGASERW